MLLPRVLIISFISLSLAAPQSRSPLRRCGNEAVPQSLIDVHQHLSTVEDTDPNLYSASDFQVSSITKRPRYTIKTYFHLIGDEIDSNSSSHSYVPDKSLHKQLDYLNRIYANTSIQFDLVGIDRTINKTWSINGDELEMKRTLRKGDYKTLNVYFQNHIDGDPWSEILGLCYFPYLSNQSTVPDLQFTLDGCQVLSSTLPGVVSDVGPFNLGGTAAHEIGHWAGLFHTFGTCQPSDSGDFVIDTPQESEPTSGCPKKKDSCPDSPGLDLVSNVMDYSDDACYTGFTPGQAARMANMLELYRLKRGD